MTRNKYMQQSQDTPKCSCHCHDDCVACGKVTNGCSHCEPKEQDQVAVHATSEA